MPTKAKAKNNINNNNNSSTAPSTSKKKGASTPQKEIADFFLCKKTVIPPLDIFEGLSNKTMSEFIAERTVAPLLKKLIPALSNQELNERTFNARPVVRQLVNEGLSVMVEDEGIDRLFASLERRRRGDITLGHDHLVELFHQLYSPEEAQEALKLSSYDPPKDSFYRLRIVRKLKKAGVSGALENRPLSLNMLQLLVLLHFEGVDPTRVSVDLSELQDPDIFVKNARAKPSKKEPERENLELLLCQLINTHGMMNFLFPCNRVVVLTKMAEENNIPNASFLKKQGLIDVISGINQFD